MLPKKGEALIAKVVGQFEKMIDDLRLGIGQCFAKQTKNSSTIDALQAENAQLETAIEQANKVIANLNKLLSD